MNREYPFTEAGYRQFMADHSEKYGKQATYAAWRKGVWLALNPGRAWQGRRSGVKGQGRRYKDASTATPEVAT